MRRNWYSSSSCHGVPRDSSTAATSPTPTAMAAAKYQRLTPARNITAPPPASSRIAVPRSGCLSTSATGIRISSSGRMTQNGRETFAGSSQCVVGGEHHHQRDLHHLRGLELHRAEVDPALRAHADDAHDVDGDEQHQRDHVGERRHRPPEADVDHARCDHRARCRRRSAASAARPRARASRRPPSRASGSRPQATAQSSRTSAQLIAAASPALRRAAAGGVEQAHARSRAGAAAARPSRAPARPRAAPRSPCAGRRVGLERRQAAVEREASGCRARSAPPPPSRRRRARRSAAMA